MNDESDEHKEYEPNWFENHSGTIGISITVLYLIFVAILFVHLSDSFNSLQLNELGDFLAGFLGPLALFWLILGYYQQRIELRQNTRALLLQHKELRDSVAHQEALAKSTSEALDDARKERIVALLPNFEITKDGYNLSPIAGSTSLNFENRGESVKMMSVTLSDNIRITADGLMDNESNWWKNGHSREVSIALTDNYNGLIGLEYQLKDRTIAQVTFDVLSMDVGNSSEIRIVELRL